jgi:putative transcriptional regulator
VRRVSHLTIVACADNDGEGGILALLALLKRRMAGRRRMEGDLARFITSPDVRRIPGVAVFPHPFMDTPELDFELYTANYFISVLSLPPPQEHPFRRVFRLPPTRTVVTGSLAGSLSVQVALVPLVWVDLAVLKDSRAKAVRFTTLEALCEVLECQPGDLLRWEPE